MSVLVVGESLVDVVNTADGDQRTHAGGSPFNVAIGLARLGVDVELASQVGDDPYGQLLALALSEAGVKSFATGANEPTSTALAQVGPNRSADYTFNLSWNPQTLPDPARFKAVHVGSLGTFIEPGAALVAGLAHSADALGVQVSFDPNVRLGVSADATAWRRAFARIAPHANILKLSDEDAAVLYPDVSASDLARRLASEGALVVVTQGAGGSLVAHRERLVIIEAPVVEVADTIGAGDSFMSAMLAWCAGRQWPVADDLSLDDLHNLAAFASRAAAITVSRPGSNPPKADELS